MGGAFALVELPAACVAGKHHRGLALRQRKADRVLNLSGGYFVVTHQAGKDRQAGSIGGSPRPRTLFVGQ